MTKTPQAHLPGARHHAGKLLATACMYPLFAVAQTQVSEAELEQLRADCHLEAEAAGLKSAALDEFIAGCVQDLISVEIANLQGD